MLTADLTDACFKEGSREVGLLWLFCKPVFASQPQVSDFGFAEHGDELVTEQQYGWVLLVASRENLLIQQYHNTGVAVTVAFSVVVVTALLALRIGQSISAPVISLENTVSQLEAGKYSSRAAIEGPIETQLLAHGINSLAESVGQSQEQLQAKVEDATRQLSLALENMGKQNEHLEENRRELQQAITAKDQFLARMSHELRTPLTAVTGFARLLNHSDLNREQAEYSENIAAASNLLLETIDGILDYLKLQTDALAIESVAFDLRALLESLVAMHAYQAYGKSLELVLIIAADVPVRLMGDPTRIKQVVNNLLSNAIKFTDRGEVVLHIECLNQSADKVQLHVSVSDSGVGIENASIGRLFQPFSQADDSITRRFGGTGLGLVICKQLVELMGGEISLESQSGQGTRVSFQLPLGINPKFYRQSPAELAYQQLCMLVYDASDWSRHAIAQQLRQLSTNVLLVGDRQQLLALLADNARSVHLLVLGLAGGEMSAEQLFSLLSQVRALYHGRILLSACQPNVRSSMPDQVVENFGPIYTLPKPIRYQALLGVLKHVDGDMLPVMNAAAVVNDKVLSGLTILIAEDNHYNRRLIQLIVEKLGAVAVTVANGEEAIRCFNDGHFDVVLMDVHMPVMDGITATEKIVALAGDEGIAVLGLTANVVDNERRALLAAGAVDILFKPLDEQALVRMICEFTGRDIGHLGRPSEQELVHGSKDALLLELQRLFALIAETVARNELAASADYLHEMLGLSGMFEMFELRQSVNDLRMAIKQRRYEQIDQFMDRVSRNINVLH
jgi:two-component system sensor histidine kinase BarA